MSLFAHWDFMDGQRRLDASLSAFEFAGGSLARRQAPTWARRLAAEADTQGGSSFTSANIGVGQSADGQRRSSSIGSSIADDGFSVERVGADNDVLQVIVNTGNNFDSLGQVSLRFRGPLRRSCNGHVWSSNLELNRVNEMNFEAFTAELRGENDAPPRASFSRWDGTSVNERGCPGGPIPNSPTRCSAESQSLAPFDFATDVSAFANTFKRRNRQGDLVKVVTYSANDVVVDYKNTGSNAFLFVSGSLPRNNLKFENQSAPTRRTLGTATEVGTLRGDGYSAGELVAHRTGAYSDSDWTNCRRGDRRLEQRTVTATGDIVSSNFEVRFLGRTDQILPTDPNPASFHRHQVRPR